MEKKTFQEVVRDIKRGEVWATHEMFDIETVSLTDNGQLVITRRLNERTDGLYIPTTKVFVLRKQIYPFNEAWKSLQEGKEIRSVRSQLAFKKHRGIYQVEHLGVRIEEECLMIDVRDMEEGWYIYE
jgi:hypothetical protein